MFRGLKQNSSIALLSAMSLSPFANAGMIDFEDINATSEIFTYGIEVSNQYAPDVIFSLHTPTTNEYLGVISDETIEPPKHDSEGNLVTLRDIVEDNTQDSLWRVITDSNNPSNKVLGFSGFINTQSIEINFNDNISKFSADFQGITADTNAGLGDYVYWYVMAYQNDQLIDAIIKKSVDIHEAFSLEKSFNSSVNRITITSTARSGMMDNLYFKEGSVANQVPVSSTLSLLLAGLLFLSVKRVS